MRVVIYFVKKGERSFRKFPGGAVGGFDVLVGFGGVCERFGLVVVGQGGVEAGGDIA